MQQLSFFKIIFKQHKWRLIITYALFGIEMLALLFRPDFFAKAADGLIYGDNKFLIQLAIIHFIFIVVGYIRHRYDTRTYTTIYNSIITKHISENGNTQNTSKLSAHSALVRELIDFLEYDLIYVVEACFNLFGSLFFLFYYDKNVAFACISILLPVFTVSYFYGKKVSILTKEKNDELEKQVDIIETQNISTITGHYKKLRLWQIKISDREAFNFGVMEFFVLTVMISSLYITSWLTHKEQEIAASTLIGIYLYIQRFTNGLDTIPYTVQRLSNLKDISTRMNNDES